MPFSRYPASGSPPLPLAAGASSAYIPFTPHLGAAGLFNMFINIAMSGTINDGPPLYATFPEIRLSANNAAPADIPTNIVQYSNSGNIQVIEYPSGATIANGFITKRPVLSDNLTVPLNTVFQVSLIVS